MYEKKKKTISIINWNWNNYKVKIKQKELSNGTWQKYIEYIYVCVHMYVLKLLVIEFYLE